LKLTMTNCGRPVAQMNQAKMDKIFDELEQFGVRHADQAVRNVTYDVNRGRFCVIDFEFADFIAKTPIENGWSRLRWSGRTDIGRFRKRNDDTFLAFTIDDEGFRQLPDEGEASIEDGDVVFVICDGMGGATSGDLASEMIAGRLREVIPRTYQQVANHLYPDRPGVLQECLEDVHNAVNLIGEKRPHLAGMGATVTVCWFTPENAYFGHVGDTRLYQLRQSNLAQLTEDHSGPWRSFKRGEINEREWRNHPRRHILEQAIGAGLQEIKPQIGTISPVSEDWFLMCSDGLIGGLWDKHVKQMLGDTTPDTAPADLTQMLLRKSLADDGRDNVSLVTIQATSGVASATAAADGDGE
ncbi:MAG: PP2C family protein-serine/threonine phosphatase, partial [Verrucomicrobiales bacterium]